MFAARLASVVNSLPFRLAAVSLLANFSIEASLVFLPLHAQGLGATDMQVGLVGSAYGVAYFLSSFIFGRLSDFRGRVWFIRAGLGSAVLAYLAQIPASDPWLLIAARAAVGFSLGVYAGALMAYVFENEGHVGAFTSIGSLGWLAGSLVGVAITDPVVLFACSGTAAALAFFVGMGLPERNHRAAGRGHPFPLSVIRCNWHAYAAFLLRHIGATAVWAIFPIYLAAIGASREWIAILNAINMGGQAVAMRYAERFNPARMIKTGLVLSAGVFAVYAVATHYAQLIVVQVVLSIAWSCLFMGTLMYLLRRNVERGTASGLLYSTNFLSTSIGPAVGGAVAQLAGYRAVMLVAASLALAALAPARGVRTDAKTDKGCGES